MKVNTRTMLQYEATECGAASLGMILGYYKKYCTLTELREACGVNRDGSSAPNVLKASRLYGLESKGFRYNIEKVKELKPPFIVFWKFYHFLVVEGYENGKFYINDPADGKYSVTEEEFSESYTGVTLTFSPGDQFKEGGKRSNIWLRILSSLNSFPLTLILLFLLGLLGVVPQLLIAGSASQFTNSFLMQGRAYFGIPIVWVSFIGVLLMVLFASLNKTILRRMEYILSKRISTNLFIKLFTSDFNFFVQRSSGEVATRLLIGLTLASTIISEIMTFGLTLLSSLIILIFTSFISIKLTIITLLVITLNIYISFYFTESRKDENKMLARQQGKVQGEGLIALSNIQMIKTCGLESETLNNWMGEYSAFNSSQQILGSQLAGLTTFALTSRFVLNISILIVGGIEVINGNFTLGGLLAFQFLQPTLQAPIGGISRIGSQLSSLDGLFGRVDDLFEVENAKHVYSLNQELEIKDTALIENSAVSKKEDNEIRNLNRNPNDGSITLDIKNLDFAYGKNAPNIFNDLTLSIRKGESLSIVGSSGSGKSTLIKIIAALYNHNSGDITYGGLKREHFGYRNFNKWVSYVPQDIFLFNASFAENITLWDESIKQSDIEWASESSCISDVILTYPEAYNHNLGQGGNKLSGGQKQRVSIARALARKPALLLFDEATSALDNETEKKVIDKIMEEDITFITVAHRLYASLKSDNVLVLDNGKPIQYGPPGDLLSESDGKFRELYEAEVGGSEK